jgi:ribonuclease P protein component
MRRSHGVLMCHYQRSTATPRVAVIVDKKVSKLAVERNQVRRRLRAALREASLPQQGDLVLRAQRGSVGVSYQDLVTSLQSCLRGLLS